METADRREIATSILSLFRQKRIECTVLHGMEGGEIGRDLDVWIPKRFWRCVSAVAMDFGRNRYLNPVRILGPFGLRFLFFGDSGMCGTLELHCVRNLDWFYVRKPDDVALLHVYKRFLMPLETMQFAKVRRELSRAPLDVAEREGLDGFLQTRRIFRNGERTRFWEAVDGGDFEKAGRLLRTAVVAGAKRHPLRVSAYFLRRVRDALWMFFKPAGVCLFVPAESGLLETVSRDVEERKGVLVKVVAKDFRSYGWIRTFFAMLRLRLAQGHQVAFVVAVRERQRLFAGIPVKPVFLDDVDPVEALATALRSLGAAKTSQQ